MAPFWHAQLARLASGDGKDIQQHLLQIRSWTARSGDMRHILEAHEIAAQAALARGDLEAARAEAEDGLLQARLCGYQVQLIELLITLSAIELAWPDPKRALVAAREALDLSMAPDCLYAWGEADAAHAWGLAFEALGERENASRALRQALEVRERIEHPGVDPTRTALSRLA